MFKDNPEGQTQYEIQCPVCGYYCLGKGGIECIGKPSLVNTANNKVSAEQQARDMLERMGIDAQSMSAGDLVELANLIAVTNRKAALPSGGSTEEMRREFEEWHRTIWKEIPVWWTADAWNTWQAAIASTKLTYQEKDLLEARIRGLELSNGLYINEIASKQEEQSLPDYRQEGAKKAAIAIDSWKLDIFKRHLERAGIAYSVSDGLAEGMLFITLRYNWVADIQPIVEAANEECRNERPT